MLVAVHAVAFVAGAAVHAGARAPRFATTTAREHTVGSAASVLANMFVVWALEQQCSLHDALAWAPWEWTWSAGAVLALQLATYVACADVWFYYTHRLLHAVPSLYQHIHAPHHAHASPTALDSLNAHPLEHLVSNVGSVLCGPCALHALGLPQFWAGMLLWVAAATWSTCAAHSGVRTCCGGMVGTHELHDLHHRYLTCNYGIGFYLMDVWHGTLRAASIPPGK